jgi:anaerobic ribonucleoside-triphosphate reductase
MTNKQIKKHKQAFATIKKEVNIAEKEQLKERLKKLVEGIRKAQKLADDVCATKYLGTDLRHIDEFIATQDQNTSTENLFREKIENNEIIYIELCRNIYYALQTEEMFNACVLAKWSCFCAAVSAVAACISVLLVLFCG